MIRLFGGFSISEVFTGVVGVLNGLAHIPSVKSPQLYFSVAIVLTDPVNESEPGAIDYLMITDGITGFLLYIFGFLLIYISISKTIKIYKSNEPASISLNSIWLVGLLFFLLRLLEQMTMIGNSLRAMSQAGDLDVKFVFERFGQIAMYSVSSLTLLILSLVMWASLKKLSRSRLPK